jgi:hypothetical protein
MNAFSDDDEDDGNDLLVDDHDAVVAEQERILRQIQEANEARRRGEAASLQLARQLTAQVSLLIGLRG